MLDDNGLLIVKESNGSSSNVMDSAISNVSGDPPISNVSNIVNASNVSCTDNVSNTDNINASAGNARPGCPDSGVPLFDCADGVASDSPPPHRGTRRWCLPRGRVSVQRRSLPGRTHRLHPA